jgi:hypothetical protein
MAGLMPNLGLQLGGGSSFAILFYTAEAILREVAGEARIFDKTATILFSSSRIRSNKECLTSGHHSV